MTFVIPTTYRVTVVRRPGGYAVTDTRTWHETLVSDLQVGGFRQAAVFHASRVGGLGILSSVSLTPHEEGERVFITTVR